MSTSPDFIFFVYLLIQVISFSSFYFLTQIFSLYLLTTFRFVSPPSSLFISLPRFSLFYLITKVYTVLCAPYDLLPRGTGLFAGTLALPAMCFSFHLFLFLFVFRIRFLASITSLPLSSSFPIPTLYLPPRLTPLL